MAMSALFPGLAHAVRTQLRQGSLPVATALTERRGSGPDIRNIQISRNIRIAISHLKTHDRGRLPNLNSAAFRLRIPAPCC
jgi:hypothetical protein